MQDGKRTVKLFRQTVFLPIILCSAPYLLQGGDYTVRENTKGGTDINLCPLVGNRLKISVYEGVAYALTCLRVLSSGSNFTTPLILAKSVSSLPLPTFAPGWILVPRCLMMIVPACTTSPSYRFTPRRCELLSLPFLELPTPFL